MDQIKQHQEQRIQSEKMAAVGYMVNTIVHDCRTPITVIKGFASLLKDFEVSLEQEKECLDFINFEVERMERMLDEILHFALDKRSPLKLVQDNLDRFMAECGIEISALFRDTQVCFTQDLQSNALVDIDRDKLRRAILNIVANAKEALKKKGEFNVSTRLNHYDAVIRLSDSGGGIPEGLRQKIFEPFFTHGKAGGFGLGMSITKKIIDDHSGEISLESEVGKGTTFIIQIPLSQGESHTLEKTHSA
jgi:signal transduction histidine kinase